MVKYFKFLNINSVKIIFLGLFAFVFIAPNSASAAALSKPANNLGLVGYWSFNDATSTKATDFSGSGNTGTLTNMANPATATSGWGNGKLGGGLNFDGSNDYVNPGTGTNLDITGSLTVSAWVKFSTLSGGQTIASKWGSVGNLHYSWLLFANQFGAGEIDFLVSGNGNSYVLATAPGAAKANQWVHVVATYSSTVAKLYINGILVSTQSSAPASLKSVVTPVTIGADRDGSADGTTRYLNGSIDEVRIYSRALSSTEITSLYNVGAEKLKVGASNNGLAGYWSFNEGTGASVADSSGNSNTGTLTNMANPAIATSGWGNGKFGGGLNFDGTNDYVNVGTGSNLDITGPLTVSAWVKFSTLSGGQTIASKWGSVGNLHYSWLLFANQFGAGEIDFLVSGTGNSYVVASAPGATKANQWVHVVGVYNASTVKIYINGKLVTTTGSAPASLKSVVTPVTIGADRDGSADGTTRYLNGATDDVRIYSRELSAVEIDSLYNSGSQKINASRNITGSSLDTGLVGLWSFDGKDMSGTTAYDRSASLHNGTLTNGPLATIGKIGQGLNFDGVNDYVDIGNYNLVGTNNITISMWIKIPSLPAAQQYLIQKGREVQNGMQYGVSISTAGKITYREIPNAGRSHEAGTTISPNVWTHIVATRIKDATTPTIYINGVVQSLTLTDGSWGSYGAPDNADWIHIGNGSTGSNNFLGSIDDVRFYSRALSADEVKSLYNLGK